MIDKIKMNLWFLHKIRKVIKNKVMSSDREFAEQFQDLLNDNVNVSF